MSSTPFQDNVVIITGASSGIGRELALQLAEQGALLSLAARNKEQLDAVANLCRQRGGEALVVPTDVTEQSQCQKLIEQTVAEYGRIDTLINNAGMTMWAHLDELQYVTCLEQIMQVNYFGSVYCTYHALPHLKKSQGRIVGVSSLAGKTGVPARTGYAASKHAMAGFFDSLRIELQDEGVSVTVVYPGFVVTEAHRRALGPDCQPLRVSPLQESKVMAVETCARIIIKAAAKRKRQEVMTLRGKIGLWLKLISPGIPDRIAKRAIDQGR